MKPPMVRLHLNSEEGEPVGFVVLDIEKITNMFFDLAANIKEGDTETPPTEDAEDGEYPKLVARISPTLAWYRGLDGKPYLKMG